MEKNTENEEDRLGKGLLLSNPIKDQKAISACTVLA
jgi:hypothetical protein